MIKNRHLIYVIILLAIIFIVGCKKQADKTSQTLTNQTSVLITGEKLEGQDCRADNECKSGVCDFYKQDFGKCALINCNTGSQAQGIKDISFFCNQNNQWQKIKNIGETCSFDHECLKRTGKDCPSCHPEDYKYYCKNNTCVEEKQLDECKKQGLKRIVSKEDADWAGDGSCIRTMAQRKEITICAPCDNGVCDTDLESKCNCPTDCK